MTSILRNVNSIFHKLLLPPKKLNHVLLMYKFINLNFKGERDGNINSLMLKAEY